MRGAQEWDAEGESEDWHEDTYEWREKLRAKKPSAAFDPKNPGDFLKNAQRSQGGMQVGG